MLLWRLAELDGLEPDLRMKAATACAQDSRRDAEGLFADIATSDEIAWKARMAAVEQAVEVADSAAAQAAFDLLRAVMQTVSEPNDEVLSRHLAELRHSR